MGFGDEFTAIDECRFMSCSTSRCQGSPVRGPLCVDCLTVAHREIRSLVLDYRDLAQRLVPTAGVGMRISGTPDPVAPMNLDIDALMSAIVWTLTVWEPPVREAARLPPMPDGAVRGGFAVASAVRVIAPRVDVLAALPPTWGFADGWAAGPVERDGVAAVDSLRELHRRARHVLGLTRLVHRLPGACSGCGLSALRRDDGSDTVRCDGCGRRWTHDDYQRYVGLLLAESEMPRAPAVVAASARNDPFGTSGMGTS